LSLEESAVDLETAFEGDFGLAVAAFSDFSGCCF
jgi:hypothetical protein